MEPSRDTHATLVDLLDRILDKGLVINADLIVSVAGIPLLGVNLRAALAGMETMLKYGVMQEWDQKSRAWESEHRKKALPILTEGENIAVKLYGSFYYDKGIYQAWRPGYYYVTNKRIILYRQDFDEITFQLPLREMKALTIRKEEHFVKEKKKQVLYVMDREDKVYRLSCVEADQLKETVEQMLKEAGLCLDENAVIPTFADMKIIALLEEGEEIIHQGKEKVWFLVPAEGIQQETWRPGHLYLTNKRLLWWNDFDCKIVFETLIANLTDIETEMKKTSGLDQNKERVMDITYLTDSGKRKASFSGKELEEWETILRQTMSSQEEYETCPQCGRAAPVDVLLGRGCPHCDWKPKIRKVMAQ